MKGRRRPFWLPASNYYVLAVSVAAGFFFVVWAVLDGLAIEMPWAVAGVSSSILMAGAVVLRETVLRREYNRFLREQRHLGRRTQGAVVDARHPEKLTLERNAAILGEIKKKSDAAKVLNKFSAGHREVFELCGEYLARNKSELKKVNPGSPRLAPLLKSRSSVADYHRYHLLQWAEIEARLMANEAATREDPREKVEAIRTAMRVIESALASYPAEPRLVETRELLEDTVVSIKVGDWVEQAERAAFDGDYAQAKSLYREALFYLARDNVQSAERERAAMRINAEIERLRMLENGE